MINQLSPYIRQTKKYISSGTPAGFVDPDYVFTLVVGGGGVIVLEGVEYEIKRGDLLFFPPYLHHLIKPASSIEQLIVHFDLFYDEKREGRSIYTNREFNSMKEYLEKNTDQLTRQLVNCSRVISLLDSDYNHLRNQLSTTIDLAHENSPFSSIFAKSVVLELIYYLLTADGKSASNSGFKTKQWAKLDEVISYIHANFNKAITLQEAASMTGVTRTYFSRLFKEYMGINFQRYLQSLRIERAKDMMALTSHNFSEIADLTGFANIHHFSKVFKLIEGCSPSQYKKSVHLPNAPTS